MAILTIARSAIARWPVQARNAFRNSVVADPERFLVSGRVDTGAVLTEIQIFLACWRDGRPWPPARIVVSTPTPTMAPAQEIHDLATRAAAIGIHLALATRFTH
jgi:hypothetical protein